MMISTIVTRVRTSIPTRLVGGEIIVLLVNFVVYDDNYDIDDDVNINLDDEDCQ